MNEKNQKSEDTHSLRKKAQEVIAKKPASFRKIAIEDMQSLIEELHVHQIELELQNEELRRAQLEIEAARDEFLNLYDFAPVGYFTIDEKGMIQKVNLTGAGMLGCERGTLARTPFSRFIYKDDQDIFYYHRRQVISSQIKKTCELRLVRKDKALFDTRLESILISDEQENPLFLRIAIIDISETRQAQKDREKALVELKEYEKIVESMDSTVTIVDVEHNYSLANKAFLSMHDKTLEQVIDRKVAEIWGKETYEQQIKTQLNRALAGENVEYEMSHLHPKIGERQLKACYFQISGNQENSPPKVAVVIKDITEQKQIEEQLRHAQKMETIGQLAAGVAHDFNNQLMVIMGYADLLCHNLQDEENQECAEMIMRSSRHSAKLTRQILAFARKGKNICVPVDIHKIISETSSILAQTIDRIIAVKQTLHAYPSVIMGDPAQLQNALLNLGINARDAIPQGGEIIFATETTFLDERYCQKHVCNLSSGQYIRISVSDNGVGIDKKIHKRIFEPFFTTKKVGKGTGMGLAAVYGIVKNHFGDVEVESEEGHGATFKIYLPLIIEKQKENEADLPSNFIKGTACILLVDDEQMVRDTGVNMLHTLGYKVTVCEDGIEALDYYKKHWQEIDLAILDMIMPRMGGRKTFRAMKEINPNIKALLATGYNLKGEAQAIIDEGVQAFMQKPFGLGELSRTINSCLKTEE